VSLKKYIRGCVSLKKEKFQGKNVEMTVNSKEENSLDFRLDFVQEFSVRCPFQVSPLTYENHSILSASEDPVSNDLFHRCSRLTDVKGLSFPYLSPHYN
jgi:hypothetical protein